MITWKNHIHVSQNEERPKWSYILFDIHDIIIVITITETRLHTNIKIQKWMIHQTAHTETFQTLLYHRQVQHKSQYWKLCKHWPQIWAENTSWKTKQMRKKHQQINSPKISQLIFIYSNHPINEEKYAFNLDTQLIEPPLKFNRKAVLMLRKYSLHSNVLL